MERSQVRSTAFRLQEENQERARPSKGTPDLMNSRIPLCSFGPGGAYIVDWTVEDEDIAGNVQANHPKTFASLIGRFAGWIARDIKGWLIASHPRRVHRIDSHPESMEPCAACGISSNWSPSLLAEFVEVKCTGRVSMTGAKGANDGAEKIAVDSSFMPRAGLPRRDARNETELEDQLVFPFPKSQDFEMVNDFAASPAGALLMRLAGTSRKSATGAAALATEDVAAEAVDRNSLALNTEYSNDTHTQAAQNSHRDPGLPRSQRLLADNAGVGRSARRFQSHNLRARRSARTKGAYPSGPEQGSLFGNLADGQAA
jgi:hypothetical protein